MNSMAKHIVLFIAFFSLAVLHLFAASDEATKRAKKIKVLVANVEGVMTTTVQIGPQDNDRAVNISVRDQTALKQARDAGLGIYLITSSSSNNLLRWAQEQGVRKVFTNVVNTQNFFGVVDNKLAVVNNIMSTQMLWPYEVAYLGSEASDIGALQKCALSCCPFDAPASVKDVCIYVSSARAGEGSLADVVDFILTAKSTR